MLPIYTRFLTPEDYGTVELLSMLIDFASIIFGARVGQAVFRYYCTSSSEEEKKSIISSALFLSGSLNILGGGFVILMATPLSTLIFSSPDYANLIILFAITMLLEPFIEIPLIHIRAQQKPWLFLVFSSIKLFLQLSLNIYFVVVLELHVEGVIYSAILSSAVICTILTVYSISRTGFHISYNVSKFLFSFSLPLKLATVGSFYLTFADRYILNTYTDLTQVGIYALGYKFGFIFLILTWDPFQKMWDTEKYNIHKQPNAIQTYQNVFLYVSIILIAIGLLISLFTKDLLRIMSDPAFLDAYKIVPIIIAAYIFQAWTKYCSFGILLSGRTMQIAHAEAIGVAVITVAYFTLIPAYGIFGAAWATLIGFAARFYWTDIKGKQSYNMQLPWRKITLTSALAIMVYLLSHVSPDPILHSIAYRVVLFAVFVLSLMYLPILNHQEKQAVRDKLVHLYSKVPLSRQK